MVDSTAPGDDDAGAELRLRMEGVSVWTPDGTDILRDIDWAVRAGEHWALLGPNGAGKTTLLALAGAVRHPSQGRVSVLGGQLGKVDMPALRRRIGVVDPTFRLLDWLTAEEVVVTGATGTVRLLPRHDGPAERKRAGELLEMVGCGGLARRRISTCSQGERQRVRLARALMPAPVLLLLDEPVVGLDLPAREGLLTALATLASTVGDLATVLVTHHLEELPATTTHALLLRAGKVMRATTVEAALTAETVSATFGFNVAVAREGGRWMARSVGGWSA